MGFNQRDASKARVERKGKVPERVERWISVTSMCDVERTV